MLLKLNTLLNELSDPIVVKFDPAFLLTPSGNIDEDRLDGASKIMESMEGNVIHYTGLESLHDILKKTKICIMDEAVNDLEPFMYPVPIITHTVLRLIENMLNKYITNTN